MSQGNDWVKDRQAAHLAAFQEAIIKTPKELIFDLEQLADDCAARAGDVACHDEAMFDLMQEAMCRHVAKLIARCNVRSGALEAWRKEIK